MKDSSLEKSKQKIHELVYSGLLTTESDDYNMLPDMTKKYSNVIDSISIHMENDLLKVSIRVKEDLFKSPILKKYTSG
ncbi:MAG: hypothetical protein HRO68_05920 [Nitrosopumilus sp.]|nr:hypothetical protein [Nitrosopumilus sp.]